jgi:integrase
MASDHLWERGRVYYLRLAIPRPCRHLFLSSNGRPLVRVVERLSDSKEVAKVMAAERVAVCMDIFARIKAGLITTPEQVKDALEPSEPDAALQPGFDEALRQWYASPERAQRDLDRRARWFERYSDFLARHGVLDDERPAARAPTAGETVNQAAEAWIAEMQRDKSAAPRQQTIDGHRLRVRAFVDAAGEVALTDVTRAIASDFLGGLKVSNRTRNNYATTLKCVFDSARRRGRFTGENPFADQRSKVVKNHKVRYTIDELQTLFDAMPREVNPKKHTPETAVPWVALIAAYSGACLEEICQLTVDDVREEDANGGRLWCIDIHNGDDGHKVKNDKARPRLLPMHSALVRAGLLEYIANLPDKRGQLFPGLKRRASKDNKIGPRVGEIYNKKLRAFGLKRKGLDFHSFRHTVSNVLDIAGVPEHDSARVLGHTIEGMTYGNYSQPGPGLKRVAAVVEQITYEGLRL